MVLPLLGAIGGALISTVGAAKGRAEERKEAQRVDEANRPVNQVAEWEAAGINPIFGLSSGAYVPHQGATGIGDTYLAQGKAIGDGFESAIEGLRKTKLEQENEDLRDRLIKERRKGEPSNMQRHGPLLPLPSVTGDGELRYGPPRRRITNKSVRDAIDGNRQALAAGTAVESLVDSDETVQVEDGKVTRTPWQDTGSILYDDPRVTDAEMAEARFADVGSAFKGVSNIVKVFEHNVHQLLNTVNYGSDVARRYQKVWADNPDMGVYDALQEAKRLEGWTPPEQPAIGSPFGMDSNRAQQWLRRN